MGTAEHLVVHPAEEAFRRDKIGGLETLAEQLDHVGLLAAFVLTVAPELLRSFSEYRVLLFGVLMVVMMIWRPRGLIRISRTGVTPRKGVAP